MGRVLLIILSLLSFGVALQAEEQERSLIDRLLRPDLSLVNVQQDKKFVPAKPISLDKTFEPKSLSAPQYLATKEFFGIPVFFARTLDSKKFAGSNLLMEAAASLPQTYAQAVAPGEKSSLTKSAPDSDKRRGTHAYADNRPFLGQGSREKFLSPADHPLSIEEVRELLNRGNAGTDSP